MQPSEEVFYSQLTEKISKLQAKVKALEEEDKAKQLTLDIFKTESELHKADSMELRARLHKIGDDRLEEAVKHCTTESVNRELKEQVQELQAENKNLKTTIQQLIAR